MEYREKPLVTVYTQAYNSEKYIKQCIESVLKQSYDNFEYFICNHGSTDRTLEIIREYERKDSRIIVVEKPNEERGFYPDIMIEQGRGKYFTMLDSDDYWAEDYLEKLIDFAEENVLDMAVCGIWQYNEDIGQLGILRQPEKQFVYEISENALYFPGIYNFLRTVWGKVIRMEILHKADFSTYRLNAQAFISDDTAFTLANYEHCKRIGAIPDLLLYYRVNPQSVTAKYNPALVENNVNIYRQSERLLSHIGDTSSESYVRILSAYWDSVGYACRRLFTSGCSYSEQLAELRRLFSTELMTELLLEKHLYQIGCVQFALQCIQQNAPVSNVLSEQDVANINFMVSLFQQAVSA